MDAVDVANPIGQRRPVADDLDEPRLVRAAQAGDRRAFEQLYDRYGHAAFESGPGSGGRRVRFSRWTTL